MTKKLEPGCKAITVNCLVPENNGKIVTVLKITGKARWRQRDGSVEEDYVVYIDKELIGVCGTKGKTVRPDKLRRIDDKEETTTWEAMRDLWVPEQIKTRELL